jgi:hypothetical protein
VSKCEDKPPFTLGMAMSSPSGRYSMQFSTNGKSLTLVDTTTGEEVWRAGPFANCTLPLSLQVLPGGDLGLVDSKGQVAWHSQTSCMSTSTCFAYRVTVRRLTWC